MEYSRQRLGISCHSFTNRNVAFKTPFVPVTPRNTLLRVASFLLLVLLSEGSQAMMDKVPTPAFEKRAREDLYKC